MIDLCEITTTQGFSITEERTSPLSPVKSLKIKGRFSQADTLNQNGRIYPLHILRKAVDSLQESIQAKRCLGELMHPADSSPVIDLRNVSHMITNLEFHGNELVGTAIIFDSQTETGTPNGRILGSLIRNGVQTGVSSRGLGSVYEDNNRNFVVSDLKLITWDAVSDPSCFGAYPTVVEESRNRALKNALEEQNFYDSFRDSIRDILNRK